MKEGTIAQQEDPVEDTHIEINNVVLEKDGANRVFVWIYSENIARFHNGIGIYADATDRNKKGFNKISIRIDELNIRDTEYGDTYVSDEDNGNATVARPDSGRYAGGIYISKRI